MTESRIALNRRHFLECLSALGLASTVMPEALTIAAQGADIVTIDVLEAAQKLAGVSFTRAEQQAILTRLNATAGYMAGSAFLRKANIGDSAQPAIVFNPVPPGKILPSGPRGLIRRAPEVSRPSTDGALAFLPVTHLARLSCRLIYLTSRWPPSTSSVGRRRPRPSMSRRVTARSAKSRPAQSRAPARPTSAQVASSLPSITFRPTGIGCASWNRWTPQCPSSTSSSAQTGRSPTVSAIPS